VRFVKGVAGIAAIAATLVAFLTPAFETGGAHGLIACESSPVMACLGQQFF
jgi:hypothetical protein